MSLGAPVSEAELSAFLDGELADARARDVAAAIEADPALAARLAAFSADKAMLKDVFGPLAATPVPQDWVARAQAPRRTRPWRSIAALAACLMVAVIGGALYLRQPAVQEREIVAAALAARDGKASGSDVAGAVAGQINDVASQAAHVRVKIPDLKPMGYSLTALHVYDGGEGAAEMIYRDGRGRRFSLYVRRSDGKPRFDQFAQGGERICVWQDEELGMVMSGDVSTAAMQRLASLAYTGLTL
jgi:anti-sigma factor RsiW